MTSDTDIADIEAEILDVAHDIHDYGETLARADNDHPTVIQAIAQVSAEVGKVGKARRHGGRENFAYRGIDDVINALSPVLATHGVVIVPVVQTVNVVPWEGYGDPDSRARANPWTRTELLIEYQVFGPAGDHVAVSAFGVGLDNGDKGSGKAASYAYKTFVSQLFCIPTDDPAMDNEHAPGPMPDGATGAGHRQAPAPVEYLDQATVAELKARSMSLPDTQRAVLKAWLQECGQLPEGRLPTRVASKFGAVWRNRLAALEGAGDDEAE